jgi:protein TonB
MNAWARLIVAALIFRCLLAAQPSMAEDLVDSPAVRPPNCAKYLPPGMAPPNSASATLFSFRLTAQGDMRDVALFGSSGNASLDKAALACAGDYHMPPITVAGTAVEITWIMGYFWRPRSPTFAAVTPSGQPDLCTFDRLPPGIAQLHVSGTTVLSYRIGTDGAVKDLLVAQSSGNDGLDQASLDCVASWRFFPAKQNGQPVEIDRTAVLQWQL